MLPRLTQSNLLERLLPVRSREASLASQHSRFSVSFLGLQQFTCLLPIFAFV